MINYKGEYNGAALQSFILALGHSQPLIQKILDRSGIGQIDPNRWYDLVWALSLYNTISKEVGPVAVTTVGTKMIEVAPFPPEINDVRSVLASLDAAYRLNVRGPCTGQIVTTFDGERSATIEWTTPGPCALNIGIIQGCCRKFGARALIEHGAAGCTETGADTCIYRVSW